MGLTSYLNKTPLSQGIKRLLRPRRKALPLLRMVRKLHQGEQLPAPAVPEPYRLLRHEPGDEARWVELLNTSGEFGTWTPERLYREMGAVLLPGGGVFAAAGDQLIGCAAACLMEEYRPYAILMYVALLPEHRGKGLGQALTLEAMRVAQAQKFPGMLLHTEAHRPAAVRTYFRLGFLPRLGEGAAGKREWFEMLNKALFECRD
jgi:ribosomal protein S18 acetylase RimI-like enzyme